MAKRLHAEFFSQNGTEYDIELYDSSFVGTSQEVITHDLQIRWESEGDMPLEPLKASKASFSIVNNSAAVDAFLTSMKSGNEDDFQMVIRKNGSLFWAGVVLIDLLSWADTPKNRVVTIQAIDGIGRLKDIPFTWASDTANPDTNTLLKYVYEILEYNNLSTYWGASDAYFYESCEFYDTQITTPAATDSPFLLTRCERTLFLTNDVLRTIPTSKLVPTINFALPTYRNIRGTSNVGWKRIDSAINEYKPITCGDALAAIMQLMCCRIMMSDGAYHIQQLRNFDGATYNRRLITKGLTVSSAANFSHRQTEGTDVKRAAGGVWTYLPPLNLATVLYTPPPIMRYDGGSEEPLDSATTPITRTMNIGTVRGGSGTGRTMKVYAHIRNDKNVLRNNSKLTIDIQIKCGTYRVKSTQAAKNVIEWTTVGTDKVTREQRVGTSYGWAGHTDIWFEFETPEIPFTKETGCTIDFTYTLTSINASSPNAKLVIKPEAAETLIESDRNQNALFEVNNPNTQNSKRIDFGNLGLVDRDDPSTANNIEIYDGTSWEESGLWDCGYPTDYTLHQGVPMEAVSLQRTPNDVFQGPIFVPASYSGKDCVYPHMTYYYDTTTYWFNGGTWICNHDRMQGEWVQYTFNSGSMSPVVNKSNQGGDINPDDWNAPRISNKDEYDRDWWDDQQLAEIKTNTGTGSVTSIAVVSLDRDLRDGDTLTIIDPYTNTIMDTCTVNGNQTSGATSITVNSFTPSQDLYVGALVTWKKSDIRESEIIRAKDYLITTSTTVPTASTQIGADGAILNPNDGYLYYDAGGGTYRITGTLLT